MNCKGLVLKRYVLINSFVFFSIYENVEETSFEESDTIVNKTPPLYMFDFSHKKTKIYIQKTPCLSGYCKRSIENLIAYDFQQHVLSMMENLNAWYFHTCDLLRHEFMSSIRGCSSEFESMEDG